MKRAVLIALFALAWLPARADAAHPTVRFDTSLGAIDVRLFAEDAPNTVATFLRYVAAGSYDASYFHRSVRDFVLQGGGYRIVDGQSAPVNELIADPDPFKRPNQRGTLAIARRPGQPGVSTSQFFFNQTDNPALDASADNYTVFGRVADRASLAVVDAIGDLQIIDGSGGQAGSAFGELPVRDYAGGALANDNLVLVRSVTVVRDNPLPYALPFRLKRRDVSVRRRGSAPDQRLEVRVRRLPAGTNVFARRGRAKDVASAPRGTARLVFVLAPGARRQKVTVTVTPPGEKATSVTVRA